MLFLRVLAALAAIHLPILPNCPEAAESLQSHRLHARRRPPTAVTSAEFATNLTLPRKAPSLGPIKKIKVVDPSVIYLKDATGTTLVELDVELTVD